MVQVDLTSLFSERAFLGREAADWATKSRAILNPTNSLRASSPIWASDASLARTRSFVARSRVLARLIRRACSQAIRRRTFWKPSSVPELTYHELGRGLYVNPYRGKGAAKAWCSPRLGSLENEFTDHVSAFSLSCQILKNVSGRLANERNERIPLTHVLGCMAISGQGGKGGDEALNSLLKASLGLKLSLSCRAWKQLEMAKLRVSFS